MDQFLLIQWRSGLVNSTWWHLIQWRWCSVNCTCWHLIQRRWCSVNFTCWHLIQWRWCLVNSTCWHTSMRYKNISEVLTLSLLGYLKTRICWGGQFDPPPLNPMFDVQIWQMIHHWKALVLYFWNLQKICKFAKIEFFIAKSSYKVKLFAKKHLSKKWTNFLFLETKSEVNIFENL